MHKANFDSLYPEMKRIAKAHLKSWNRDAIQQTTVVVHDAYLRLSGKTDLTKLDRTYCLRLVSRSIRHVLVDAARARNAEKRGGGEAPVTLPLSLAAPERHGVIDVLVVEDLMRKLSAVDEKLGLVAECRLFGGFSMPETADAVGIPLRSAERYWMRAKAYLLQAFAES